MWTKLEAGEQFDLIALLSSQLEHLVVGIALGTWLIQEHQELESDNYIPGIYSAAKEIQPAFTYGGTIRVMDQLAV